MDPKADYGALEGLARQRVNTKLIAQNWDDMLRVAGSLKLSTISASELTRSLLRSNRPSTLARAISELGRVPKTLYLLSYIDDETYRRRILTQLNRGEDRHSVSRAVFHGQRGEIRQRYREGQEDQLGALGLVVNIVVLWNTLYMNAALNHLRNEGIEVRPEDAARLSPLGHENINFLGRYSCRDCHYVVSIFCRCSVPAYGAGENRSSTTIRDSSTTTSPLEVRETEPSGLTDTRAPG